MRAPPTTRVRSAPTKVGIRKKKRSRPRKKKEKKEERKEKMFGTECWSSKVELGPPLKAAERERPLVPKNFMSGKGWKEKIRD